MKTRLIFLIVLGALIKPLMVLSQDQSIIINKLKGNWEETIVRYQGKGHLVGGFGEKGSIKFNDDQSLEWSLVRYVDYSGVLRGVSSSSFTAEWTISADNKLVLSNATKGNFLSILGSAIVIEKMGTKFSFKYGKNGFGETVIQIMMPDGAEHIYKKID